MITITHCVYLVKTRPPPRVLLFSLGGGRYSLKPMILSSYVRNTAEEFIKTTLAKWPKVTDVLLSHPNWPAWCDRVATELTRQETESYITKEPFNAHKEIQVWAASYADHALSKAQDAYLKQAQDELSE